MEAKVLKVKGVTVVNLKGFIDVETAAPFRDACIKTFQRASLAANGNKVVFNLEQLQFVGSNGIIPFVESLHDICDQESIQVKFCRVGSEFKKVFQASPLRDIEIFNDEEGAISAFDAKKVEEIGA
ncbi:MAG: STAS domain-containing protein [Bdellovibrionaceae bacterium]|nr:STAS domain-containing protein [Pseudobdellovibrionaceae bacterium]